MTLELDELLTPRMPGQPPPLDRLSVEELAAYIERLRAEITRAEAAIAGKQSHRAVADALFRI